MLPAVAAPATQPVAGTFVAVGSTTVAGNVSVPAGGTVDVPVAGRGPVPAGATAVAVNVGVLGTAGGSIALHPTGTATPPTADVTYRPGSTARVAATRGLSGDGRLAVSNRGQGAATVTIDVQGYSAAASAQPGAVYVALTPVRTVSNVTVAAGRSTTFTAVGAGGVASTAVSAVAITVIVQSGAAGRATVYPSGATDPGTPQVEYVPGGTAANFTVVRPGPDGKVVLANGGTASASVSVEVAGYYSTVDTTTPGARLVPTVPQRLRSAVSVAAGTYIAVQAAGQAGLPASGVAAACVHLSVTGPATTSSALLVYPTDVFFAPTLSTVRYYAGLTSTGSVTSKVHTDGKFRVYNTGTQAVTVDVDVSCYYQGAHRPAPPSHVYAAAADTVATVSWQAPDNGGATLTAYEVTSTPDGRTATVTGDVTSATVTGLKNGSRYHFAVKARNAAGVSDASALSTEVVPAAPQPPQAPFVTSVFPRDRAVRVSWSPPPGGAAGVTAYQVSADPGGATVDVDGQQTEATLGGLTNGTAYVLRVVARNGAGNGPVSPPSEPVVPSPADPPLKPSALLVVALNQRIDVQWVAPPDGGAPISGYRVSVEPGTHVVDVAADTTVTAVTGLTNGTAYTVRVVARNAAGTGPAAEQGPVVPAAVRAPAAPTNLRVGVSADGTVALRWTAPVDTGTSAVNRYTITADPGGAAVSSATTTAVLGGLDRSRQYRFKVTATNTAGTGPAGPPSQPVTPKVAVKATPKVFTTEEAATLRVVRTDGSLVFEQPPATVSGLATGTVVVLNPHPAAPKGLFRKVTGVSAQGGLVTVTTAPAALTEVFDDTAVAAMSEVGNDEVAQFLTDSPAIRRKQPTLHGRTLRNGARRATSPGIDIGLRNGHVVVEVALSVNTEQPGDPLRQPTQQPPLGGRLEAQLDLAPQLDNAVYISASQGVDTYHRVAVAYTAQLRTKLGLIRGEEITLPGAKIQARCFDIQAGPVPIIICLEFNVKPKINIDGSVGITAAVTFGRVIGAEMHTHNGTVTSYQGINQSTGAETSSLQAYADGNVTFSLPFETTVYFYNTAGPGLIIRPYAQLKLDTTQDPWWEVRVGITLGIFFRTREFFGHHIEFAKEDVVNFFVTVLDAGGPFTGLTITPGEATVDPGETVHLQAAATGYPSTIPIRWRMVAGPGSIDDTGSFHSPLAGSAVVEAYSPAGAGRPELVQRATIHVRGFTLPSAPRTVTATAKALAAQVSWAPPATDGNTPIRRYAIVSTPASGTVLVAGDQSTARIPALSPGVEYTFQVYAINDKGTSDASGPSEPVTPYEALRITAPAANVAVDADGVADTSNVAGRHGAFVSGNGRYVFFETADFSNLAPPEIFDPNTNDGSAIYLLRKDRFTGEITVASRSTDGVTPVPVYLAAGATNARLDINAATNYDGSVVAYQAQVAPGGGFDLVRYQFGTRTATNLTHGTGVSVGRPVLSRDGTVIAFDGNDTNSDEHLYLSTDGLAPHPVDKCHFTANCGGLTAFTSFDLAGNGTIVYYTEDDRTHNQMHLYRRDLTTGAETDLSAPPARALEQLLTVATSADGTTIAAELSTYRDDADTFGLLVKNPTTGTPVGPADVVINVPSLDWINPTDVSEDGHAVAYQYYDGTSFRAYVYDAEQAAAIPLFTSAASSALHLDLAANASVATWTRCDGVATQCQHITGVWAQSLT